MAHVMRKKIRDEDDIKRLFQGKTCKFHDKLIKKRSAEKIIKSQKTVFLLFM